MIYFLTLALFYSIYIGQQTVVSITISYPYVKIEFDKKKIIMSAVDENILKFHTVHNKVFKIF